jgi:hypothetical protein
MASIISNNITVLWYVIPCIMIDRCQIFGVNYCRIETRQKGTPQPRTTFRSALLSPLSVDRWPYILRVQHGPIFGNTHGKAS